MKPMQPRSYSDTKTQQYAKFKEADAAVNIRQGSSVGGKKEVWPERMKTLSLTSPLSSFYFPDEEPAWKIIRKCNRLGRFFETYNNW